MTRSLRFLPRLFRFPGVSPRGRSSPSDAERMSRSHTYLARTTAEERTG